MKDQKCNGLAPFYARKSFTDQKRILLGVERHYA
jgi:hypothetical protein